MNRMIFALFSFALLAAAQTLYAAEQAPQKADPREVDFDEGGDGDESFGEGGEGFGFGEGDEGFGEGGEDFGDGGGSFGGEGDEGEGEGFGSYGHPDYGHNEYGDCDYPYVWDGYECVYDPDDSYDNDVFGLGTTSQDLNPLSKYAR